MQFWAWWRAQLIACRLLTITGFSVNDTSNGDRTGEILKVNPERPISEVVDDAVNQTPIRSINTTFYCNADFICPLFGGRKLEILCLALIVSS